MKQNTIETLLEKHRNGTLTDEELSRLATISRRDEVLAEADRRADAIIRRRRASVMTFSAIAAIAVGAFFIVGLPKDETPQVAMQMPTTSVEKVPEAEPLPATEKTTEPVQVATAKPTVHSPKADAAVKNDEPVVMCNNQCDADSVISDIWKFLTA